MQAIGAAVDNAGDGLVGVRDRDGEDGDVRHALEAGVMHGPGEVLVQEAADLFLGRGAHDTGVAGALADFDEVVERFLGCAEVVSGGSRMIVREGLGLPWYSGALTALM